MDSKKLHDVTIIGGGAGGCSTALELAKTGLYKINLIEKNKDLMKGSSDCTPGRMGLGFHYADESTALYYLHATLEFTKKFGRFRQEIDKSSTDPLRRGRYFILKNSLVPKADILQTYDALKAEYTRIVHKDPSYELFGPPEQFYRILETHEFGTDVVVEKIDIGIETAEELLDWPKIRRFIIEKLERLQKKNKLIIKTNTEVYRIMANYGGGYIVESMETLGSEKSSRISKMSTDVIVNASWYNIAKFSEMLGFCDRKRCNRIKAIATVRLPQSLVNKPSMFFCMGPFCMFSNKGNGIGMLTYASETNMAASTSVELEPELAQIFFDASENDKNIKGQRIIEGVSSYIPDMKNAKLIKVNYGIIQTFMDTDTIDFGFRIGDLDFLHHPNSGGIYKRDYSGIEMPRPDYIINACVKLLYCFSNAALVRNELKLVL